MTVHEVDVVVLGMGPGGEDAAGRLASAGLSVAGVEARLVGGECPYWGCVPSKMMVRAAGLLAGGRRIPGLAGSAQVHPDWAPVAQRIREEATDHWDDKVAAERFTGQGGTLFRGHGRITAPGEVTVGRDVLRARRAIVINTGTQPSVPPIDGLAGTPYWTNREAIEAIRVPASLLVLGGGAIGAELSQVFARFGARVTVIEGAARLLPPEEPEAGALLADVFAREGIAVRTGTTARAVRHDGTAFTLVLSDGTEVTGDALLVATGRRTDLAGIGAGVVGVDESARALPVDDHLRVAPGVWAIGDITGHGAFTHMSMYQASIVVHDILGEEVSPAEYHAVPRVTFTDPEIGSVGLSERQARDRGLDVRASCYPVPRSTRGWIHQAGNDGFIKLVADAGPGILAGASSAGPAGGEVLSMLTLAVHARVPVRRLREMIYAYPTFHRTIEAALQELDL
ncbi:MAG TPA: NAD(P)/FAD-dependent oxidoreductase [Streptosporangiaceae bacterium]|jgi:pyruvate/2-oxoglutarate dehydrogenase complex dihydrolipoamide dehydrogenase (E3) component